MNQEELVYPHERLDDLERSGLKIIQNPGKFCFGMDAVLLSGFVRAKNGDKVLDLCTGNGIIPILLYAKTEAKEFWGIEIQEEVADMARRSVEYNAIGEKVHIFQGDVRDIRKIVSHAAFDVVTVNPPYMNDCHGIKNPNSALAIARHEVLCTLEDVVSAAAFALKTSGHFFMVHRPHRLMDELEVLRTYKLEPKRICFVHPFVHKDANMVLIEAIKGGGCFMKVEPPIIVYEREGKYTQQIYDLYGY